MAEVTRRRVGELKRGVFKVLLEQPEGLAAKEVLLRMEQVVPPTDFERTDYTKRPGVRRFEKMVRFATIAPVKAGWLIKSKGRWYLTEEGRKAYQGIGDPEKFAQEATRLFRQWRASQADTVAEVAEGAPEAASTIEEAEEEAWGEIRSNFISVLFFNHIFFYICQCLFSTIQDYLQKMGPYDFQELVAALLRAMGYHVSWIAPPGPDKGIDILAHNDPLGTSVPRIKVQVKRRMEKVNVEGLRSFMAVLGEQDVGIFVSTGGFTTDAQEEARTQEKRKITLLDLEQLFDLWVQHYERVAEAEKRLLPLKPVYYLGPSE